MGPPATRCTRSSRCSATISCTCCARCWNEPPRPAEAPRRLLVRVLRATARVRPTCSRGRLDQRASWARWPGTVCRVASATRRRSSHQVQDHASRARRLLDGLAPLAVPVQRQASPILTALSSLACARASVPVGAATAAVSWDDQPSPRIPSPAPVPLTCLARPHLGGARERSRQTPAPATFDSRAEAGRAPVGGVGPPG